MSPNFACSASESGASVASAADRPSRRARNDSHHLANQPLRMALISARLAGSQSNVAHHSTKARSPSITGVTRKVAWKSATGSERVPQNSQVWVRSTSERPRRRWRIRRPWSDRTHGLARLTFLDPAFPRASDPDRVVVEIANDFTDLGRRLLKDRAVIGLGHRAIS